jgi:hypothetical protein
MELTQLALSLAHHFKKMLHVVERLFFRVRTKRPIVAINSCDGGVLRSGHV